MAGKEAAKVYAGALLELGQEKNMLSRIEEELGFVASLINEDRTLVQYLNAPGVSVDAKKQFISKVFSDNLSELVVNFIKLTIDKNRQGIIRDIYTSLKELIDDANNRQRVKVTSAIELNEESKKKIKLALEDKYKKEIILEERTDETILGGIVIKIGDVIIDSSLAKDLRIIKENLLISKVRSEAAYED